MRKILTVVLILLQLGFVGGMIGYQKTAERRQQKAENGPQPAETEYTFAVDGSFVVYYNDRDLRLTLRQKGGGGRSDRYWQIVTGKDGVSCVKKRDARPISGAYITAAVEDGYPVFDNPIRVHVLVKRSFEERYFPTLQRDYAAADPDADDADTFYKTEDVNDPAYGNTFTVRATVKDGEIAYTDFLVNGESFMDEILSIGN
ncbi:MAG: hypothetical protein IJK89_02865 [Clostridia bacterium]|nr:hypothetical protein [Clostridia bacterium]